jgi:uncharacterized membrane-anchored protein
MRTYAVIAAVALQLFALAYLAGEREWILRTGRVIHLRTTPMDPMDAMRGAYVRLNYPISNVPRSFCRDGLADTSRPLDQLPRDLKVFAQLELEETGFGELASLSDRRPTDGVFLRGRLERSWGNTLNVRYGLEAFFMQQEKAAEVEQQRWQQSRGVPLIVDVAVSARGVGVLRSSRWDTLGLTLNLVMTNVAPGRPDRSDSTSRQPARALTAAEVVLRNHGQEDIGLVNLPNGRSFTLVADSRWGEAKWQGVASGQSAPPPAPQPENVVILKPGQSWTNQIEFSDPGWFVVGTNATAYSLTELREDWSTRFRIEYRPPGGAMCKHLADAKLIWHGRLPSRAFGVAGGVD